SFIQHVDSGDQLRIVSEYGDIRLRTGTGGVEADALLLDQAQRAYFYANVNLGANDLNNVGNIFASYMELSTNLYFTGTGDVGITYTSADGSRYGLLFEGSGTTDKVVLANRHANGIVEIRANSATAGGAGETTVAGFYDTALEVFKQLRMNGNPLYLEGGDLYTGGGRIHGSSNAIEIDPGGSNLVYLEPTDSKGAGYTGTGLIVRTWSNPNTNHPIFQVRSSGEAERFSVHHGAEHAEVASDGVRVAGSTYGADATIADDIFMTTAMETFTTGGYATLRRRDSDGKVMELVSSGDYKRDNVVVEPNFGDRIMQTRVKRGRAIEGRGDPDDWSVWLLAEELAGVYPEFVRWDPDNPNRALSIHYEYLTLPLIVKTQAHEQALWEYGAEIGSQRTALGVQESEIRALRDRVGVLESQVAALAAG
ncbi:MAG: hypothetical protein R3324_00345, partial [Halobacteriales archaeon]|nr:hypothetical protein [Halobacteriales archaeon]